MNIDLIVVAFFVGIYFLLLFRNQFSALIAAVSLLITVLFSRFYSVSIETFLSRNGYAKEGYPVIIFYLLIIIISWGLIYALLSNFKAVQIESYKKISSVFISALFAVSFAVMLCFVTSNLSVGKLNSNDSWLCRTCKVDKSNLNNASKTILSPDQLDEVIVLPESFVLKNEDAAAEKEVLNYINNERLGRSISALSPSEPLNVVANNYAESIINSLRFSHLDANNNSPAERASSGGIHYSFLGENLAIAPNILVAHNALMDSPAHKANILSNRFGKVGISVFSLKNGSIIVVEEFIN